MSRTLVYLALAASAWVAVGCAAGPPPDGAPRPVPDLADVEAARAAAGEQPPGDEQMEAARGVAARGATSDSCNYAPRESYWFCRALESRNCNYAGRDGYWFCRALVEGQCNYAGRDQYWFCRALVERQCNYASRDQYWLCRGLVENRCNYAPRDQYWYCRAVAPPLQALSRRSSSLPTGYPRPS